MEVLRVGCKPQVLFKQTYPKMHGQGTGTGQVIRSANNILCGEVSNHCAKQTKNCEIQRGCKNSINSFIHSSSETLVMVVVDEVELILGTLGGRKDTLWVLRRLISGQVLTIKMFSK